MNSILAQYLFNKEIIYKNPSVQEAPVSKESVMTKENTQAIAVAPAQAVKENLQPVVSKPAALQLTQEVLILAERISEDEKAFLGKILSAVGLSLAQVDLIDVQVMPTIDYPSFLAQKTTSKLISFGVGFSKLNWDVVLTPYQLKSLSGITFLLANNLQTISTDTAHKKNLWAALQVMFNK
ncbi:hypothetical protein [Emticicia sp. TH156]|uniref:hypothetical protein n=1 Tax=Emticicia sp. TH156 TaxID=2067454 RepID=UPI000C77C10B|nr:hypothetical protein [Emticicia sp. TH156]PLK45454.1 hypothetical protein C0V77_04765 [Emticicia sp. TH156]